MDINKFKTFLAAIERPYRAAYGLDYFRWLDFRDGLCRAFEAGATIEAKFGASEDNFCTFTVTFNHGENHER